MPQKFFHNKNERDKRSQRIAKQLEFSSKSELTSVDTDSSLLVYSLVSTTSQSSQDAINNVANPVATLSTVSPTPLACLHSNLVLPSRFWSDHSPSDLHEIPLCKISCHTQLMNVTHNLTINSDLSWLLFINQHMVDSNMSTALKPFSGPMNTDKLNRLLELLDGPTKSLCWAAW